MWIYPLPPESVLGWTLSTLGLLLQAWAVVVVLGDVRGRRVSLWDVAALAFVVVLGPYAASLFLAVHSVLQKRQTPQPTPSSSSSSRRPPPSVE